MAVSAETLAEATALIEAQAQARQVIAGGTQAAVVAQVRIFTGWYDHAAITRLAGLLAKLTRAGQRQTAASTDAYARQVMRLLAGQRPTKPRLIDVSSGLRAAVPLEASYGRLADQYRYLTARRGPDALDEYLERRNGLGDVVDPFPRLTQDAILDRVVLRATVQADDNLALAMRDQWAADLQDAPAAVTGWRRVIHPEVIATGSTAPGPVCGLCIVAADRTYGRAELLPLHDLCRCGVVPIVGDEGGNGDPGSALNAVDLKALYAQAGGTASAKLRQTRYRVVDHGELGPRLEYETRHKRTAAEAAAADEVPPAEQSVSPV